MARLALRALAAALCVSCSAREPCDTYTLEAGAEAYREGVAAGLAAWSDMSGRRVRLGAEGCAIRVADGEEYQRIAQASGGDFFGARARSDGTITLAPDQWDASFFCTDDIPACVQWIVMHEIAHEYGMEHTDNPQDVMGVGNPAPRLDYSTGDRAQWERLTADPRR